MLAWNTINSYEKFMSINLMFKKANDEFKQGFFYDSFKAIIY